MVVSICRMSLCRAETALSAVKRKGSMDSVRGWLVCVSKSVCLRYVCASLKLGWRPKPSESPSANIVKVGWWCEATAWCSCAG